MWVSKDKSGTILISKDCPERTLNHWRPINHKYCVMNAKWGMELFPELQWENNPIEIENFNF